MNVIINVPSKINILFTLDELTVVSVGEKKTCTALYITESVGEKNYMATYPLRRQEILGARDWIRTTFPKTTDVFVILIHLCIF